MSATEKSEIVENAIVWAINELKYPHPNQENKKITIDALEKALNVLKGT